MNIFVAGKGSQSHENRTTIAAGNLPLIRNTFSKSEKEKLERQQKAASQIDFWEKQKENLKGMECGTIEEIAKKLETLQTYEDSIAAAKASYNREQMWHVLDEAKELSEKIAKKLEEMKPKTGEEKLEDMAEEALEPEEGESTVKEMLEEMLEEAVEMMEEVQEELSEETTVEYAEELAEEMKEISEEKTPEQKMAETKETVATKEEFYEALEEGLKEERKRIYSPMDVRI